MISFSILAFFELVYKYIYRSSLSHHHQKSQSALNNNIEFFFLNTGHLSCGAFRIGSASFLPNHVCSYSLKIAGLPSPLGRHLVSNGNAHSPSFTCNPADNGLRAGMLIAMLAYYAAIGSPHYPSMDPGMTIPHISDVGAFTLKPLFITGSVLTTIFLDLAFLSERYLRHNGRLARHPTKTEKLLSNLSLFFAVIGTAGLILLSIFDSYRYGTAHNIFLFMFMGGYIVSAIFICWSYQRLGIRKSIGRDLFCEQY